MDLVQSNSSFRHIITTSTGVAGSLVVVAAVVLVVLVSVEATVIIILVKHKDFSVIAALIFSNSVGDGGGGVDNESSGRIGSRDGEVGSSGGSGIRSGGSGSHDNPLFSPHSDSCLCL